MSVAYCIKRTSLFHHGVSDSGKKIYSIDSGACTMKLFTAVIYGFP